MEWVLLYWLVCAFMMLALSTGAEISWYTEIVVSFGMGWFLIPMYLLQWLWGLLMAVTTEPYHKHVLNKRCENDNCRMRGIPHIHTDPVDYATCVICGAEVCKINDCPVHPDGAEMRSKAWVCSEKCFDKAAAEDERWEREQP